MITRHTKWVACVAAMVGCFAASARAEYGLPSQATLEAMGLGGLEILSDDEATAVRGMGYESGGGNAVAWGMSKASVGKAVSVNGYYASGKHYAVGLSFSKAIHEVIYYSIHVIKKQLEHIDRQLKRVHRKHDFPKHRFPKRDMGKKGKDMKRDGFPKDGVGKDHTGKHMKRNGFPKDGVGKDGTGKHMQKHGKAVHHKRFKPRVKSVKVSAGGFSYANAG